MADEPESIVLRHLAAIRGSIETMERKMEAGFADVRAELGDVRADVANLRAETRRGYANLQHDVREVSVAVAALNVRVANVETAE